MGYRNPVARFFAALLLCGISAAPLLAAEVTGQVTVAASNGGTRAARDAGVVFWLTPRPDQSVSLPPMRRAASHPQLIQKNKVFDPHVLAVEVGSEVDFPNRDPFFHNVFSLFNGKRFDLGLYEAGSTRGVRFDRAGVCYIFCNIHPQMSAVVVVVDTPYFAVSDARGNFLIAQVPAGRYQLDVWEEHCAPAALENLSRQVTVGPEVTSLGNIHLRESEQPVAAHLNKYGKPYDPEVFSSPLYVQP